MSISVETKSGRIECGFFSSRSHITDLGKYTFHTKCLVGLVRHVAKNPDMRESKLRDITPQNGKKAVEVVNFSICPEAKTVSIGDYVIPSESFGNFALYLLRGGRFGWEGAVPSFAEGGLNELMKSEHALFRALRN